MNKISIVALAAVAPALLVVRSTAAAPVYIALGDSITFGEMDLNYEPSAGDRGYVGLYANTLAARTGVRPIVENLAIDGETAASFTTGVGRLPPVSGRTDAILASENLNYNPAALVSQNALFLSDVAAARSAGNTVTTVSITLGFNDLGLIVPPTGGLPATTTAAQALLAYQSEYSGILTTVRQQLPAARLLLVGDYNPFPADSTNPAAATFTAYGPTLNSIIQSLATEYGGSYVDTATPFMGHEAAYTYLAAQPAGATPPAGGPYVGTEAIGNVHPNAIGYSVIAGQIAAVPEPTTAALLCVGGLALLGRRSRPGHFRR